MEGDVVVAVALEAGLEAAGEEAFFDIFPEGIWVAVEMDGVGVGFFGEGDEGVYGIAIADDEAAIEGLEVFREGF